MKTALAGGPGGDDEYKENMKLIAKRLKGNVGVCFSHLDADEIQM